MSRVYELYCIVFYMYLLKLLRYESLLGINKYYINRIDYLGIFTLFLFASTSGGSAVIGSRSNSGSGA